MLQYDGASSRTRRFNGSVLHLQLYSLYTDNKLLLSVCTLSYSLFSSVHHTLLPHLHFCCLFPFNIHSSPPFIHAPAGFPFQSSVLHSVQQPFVFVYKSWLYMKIFYSSFNFSSFRILFSSQICSFIFCPYVHSSFHHMSASPITILYQ